MKTKESKFYEISVKLKKNIFISEGLGTRKIGFLGIILGICQKMDSRQVEQGFSSFFVKFLAYLMICRHCFTVCFRVRSTLKNHQICQKFSK